MSKLPEDPMILLSYMNTQLRDFYPSLEQFCKDKNADRAALTETLGRVGYYYDERRNQFV